ncbi:MAG: hypothetical protein JSS75_07160 [Bacteroidetes bacterium]|nr:hypothetical protein [Bacteroidota bacterium]
MATTDSDNLLIGLGFTAEDSDAFLGQIDELIQSVNRKFQDSGVAIVRQEQQNNNKRIASHKDTAEASWQAWESGYYKKVEERSKAYAERSAIHERGVTKIISDETAKRIQMNAAWDKHDADLRAKRLQSEKQTNAEILAGDTQLSKDRERRAQEAEKEENSRRERLRAQAKARVDELTSGSTVPPRSKQFVDFYKERERLELEQNRKTIADEERDNKAHRDRELAALKADIITRSVVKKDGTDRSAATIEASLRRQSELEAQFKGLSLRKIEVLLEEHRQKAKAINNALKQDNNEETQQAILNAKQVEKETIDALMHIRNVKEGSNGKSIFGIGQQLSGEFSGKLIGVASSLGIGLSTGEIVKLGEESARVTRQLQGAYQMSGLTFAQARANVNQTIQDYERFGKTLGITEAHWKELSRIAAFTGHFVGEQNRQIVQAAAAIEKQTAGTEGEISADRFIRGISQGMYSDEGKEVFGRLRMSMPALVKDLEQATSKEDLFGRAIAGTNQLVKSQAEFIASADGTLERESIRRQNQVERLGQLAIKWIGSVGEWAEKADVGLDLLLGTTTKEEEAELGIKSAIDQQAESAKRAAGSVTVHASALGTDAAMAEKAKAANDDFMAALSGQRDSITLLEQQAARLKLSIQSGQTSGLSKEASEQLLSALENKIKRMGGEIKKYNDALTEVSSFDPSQATAASSGKSGTEKTPEQIAKARYDALTKESEDQLAHYTEMARQDIENDDRIIDKEGEFRKRKLALTLFYYDAEIAAAKQFGQDYGALEKGRGQAILDAQKEWEKQYLSDAEHLRQLDRDKEKERLDDAKTLANAKAENITDDTKRELALLEIRWQGEQDQYYGKEEILTEKAKKYISDRADILNKAWKAQYSEAESIAQSAGQQMFGAFEQQFFQPLQQKTADAKNWFADLFLSIVRNAIATAASKAVEKLVDSLFAKKADTADSGPFSAIPGLGPLNSIFGILGNIPKRAKGGSTPVGTPYLVGEEGPEIRIDHVPGTIIPNSMVGLFQSAGMPGFKDGTGFPDYILNYPHVSKDDAAELTKGEKEKEEAVRRQLEFQKELNKAKQEERRRRNEDKRDEERTRESVGMADVGKSFAQFPAGIAEIFANTAVGGYELMNKGIGGVLPSIAHGYEQNRDDLFKFLGSGHEGFSIPRFAGNMVGYTTGIQGLEAAGAGAVGASNLMNLGSINEGVDQLQEGRYLSGGANVLLPSVLGYASGQVHGSLHHTEFNAASELLPSAERVAHLGIESAYAEEPTHLKDLGDAAKDATQHLKTLGESSKETAAQVTETGKAQEASAPTAPSANSKDGQFGADAAVTGARGLRQFMGAHSAAEQKAAATSMVGGLAKSMLALIPGGGIASSILGGLFGFAEGTDNTPTNQPFWVGERGPEIMQPRSSYRVIPHAESLAYMRGGGGSHGGGGYDFSRLESKFDALHQAYSNGRDTAIPSDMMRQSNKSSQNRVINNTFPNY